MKPHIIIVNSKNEIAIPHTINTFHIGDYDIFLGIGEKERERNNNQFVTIKVRHLLNSVPIDNHTIDNFNFLNKTIDLYQVEQFWKKNTNPLMVMIAFNRNDLFYWF